MASARLRVPASLPDLRTRNDVRLNLVGAHDANTLQAEASLRTQGENFQGLTGKFCIL
jgi:hypothetical protein